jgi:predicted ATPase
MSYDAMIESLKLRTLIIGNSGSGKSTLAERLGALIHSPCWAAAAAAGQRDRHAFPQLGFYMATAL